MIDNTQVQGEYSFFLGSSEGLNIRIQFLDLVNIMAEEPKREKERVEENLDILAVLLNLLDFWVWYQEISEMVTLQRTQILYKGLLVLLAHIECVCAKQKLLDCVVIVGPVPSKNVKKQFHTWLTSGSLEGAAASPLGF